MARTIRREGGVPVAALDGARDLCPHVGHCSFFGTHAMRRGERLLLAGILVVLALFVIYYFGERFYDVR